LFKKVSSGNYYVDAGGVSGAAGFWQLYVNGFLLQSSEVGDGVGTGMR
jgi:hypothetical protein